MYYPIYSYLFDGKLVPFVSMEFMFVDQSTKLGFLIASMIEAVLGTIGIGVDVYMLFGMVFVIMNYRIRVDIIEIDFNELDDLWSDTSTTTSFYRRMYLRNICWKFIDMRR